LSPIGLAFLLLTSCAYPQEKFREEADAAVCAWQADCFATAEEDCETQAEASWEPPDEACDYDPGEARDCARGLEDLECPEGEPVFPEACDRVWVCP